MADWFRFYDDFFDDDRVLAAIKILPEAGSVYVFLLAKTNARKTGFDISLGMIDIIGIGLVLNIPPSTVQMAIDVLRSVKLVSGDKTLSVMHWHKERPRYIPRRLKSLVIEKFGRLCRFCGTASNIEFDHIIPISRGGETTISNLQPLCKPCNLRKGSK